MGFNFLKEKSKNISLFGFEYLLFFMICSIYFIICSMHFANFIYWYFINEITDFKLIIGIALFVLFVAAGLLFVYICQRVFLKISCKVQESVSWDDYIGSLTHPILGKIFKYFLLAGSALFAAYLLFLLIVNSYIVDYVFINSILFIAILLFTIFSIGLANSKSKQKEYNYVAAKKELNLQARDGVLIGSIFFLCLVVFHSFFLYFFLILACFFLFIFFIILFKNWEMLLVRGAIENKKYILLYFFTVLVLLSCLLLLRSHLWVELLFVLGLTAAIIFTIVYLAEYFQEINRKYRRY